VPVGNACTGTQQCNGGGCLQGTQPWWNEAFVGGYCTVDQCSMANPCPTGAACVYTDQAQQNTTCVATCTQQSQCRQGYVCIQQGFCLPGTAGGGGTSPIGGACTADSDCADQGAQCATGMPGGYCTVFSCNQNCPTGSTCYQIDQQGGTACLADCTTRGDCRVPDYACHSPGACLTACDANSCPAGEVCGPDGLCTAQDCTMTGCPSGMLCDSNSGDCVVDLGTPPSGPMPSCGSVPDWRCTGGSAHCSQLVPFEPENGPGYTNYPLNGESQTNQYRSYVRRDVRQLVIHATGMVDCLSQNWTVGNGHPLGLGDMSEANGAIPGTSIGQPGHPMNTHEDGQDMDIAYYQLTGSNNHLRAVCSHHTNGQDQYHCVGPPTNLDVWRSALFIGMLHVTSGVRVIGVDGQVGPLLESAISQLCSGGWLNTSACQSNQMTYEVTDTNRGWFRFHHHHLHLSVSRNGTLWQPPVAQACLQENCSSEAHEQLMSFMPPMDGFIGEPLISTY